ncbi:glycosyltransferase [Actinomycetospora termitidis]|uniref:Glycosyltransferase n=1 Tax=Actinomycetospora termitidis TaxID=3053470 RepID=A0ABT7M939_9PSEU|nr:glycosyltransferase [Actinomycetospora sp. Odt1-22]MDL5157194.1 glycosyltransferase [Actinomycetospora sp. Odt1-22]
MAPTAPVLAVLVCHDGEAWLPETLGALGRLTVGPRRVVAVDTGSRDSTADLLRSSNRVDVVLDLPRDTPFGSAVAAAVADADRRWGRSSERSSGDWLWVLHDDSAPEPSCLDVLLSVAEASPAVAMLGPLQLDWEDPRLVVEAGLSTDASGHRQTGIGSDELDLGQFATNSEVLAVGSAGALVRRHEWDALGGYDSAFGLLREDVDLGWRLNRAGGLVLCVPSARLHHARAASTGARDLDAVGTDGGLRTTDRRNGMVTVLANGSAAGYAVGLVRLPLLAVLRAIGFLLLRRPRAANAELGAMGRLLADLGDLGEARRRRQALDGGAGDVRGLLTSRTTRLRNAVSGGLTRIVRNRVRDDLDLGRLPDWADRPTRAPASAAAATDGPDEGALLVGQGALPAGATAPKRSSRRKAGLRRPGGESVAVSLAGPVADGEAGPTELIGAPRSGRHRTAEPDPEAATALVGIPAPRDGTAAPEPDPRLVVVPVTPGRVLRELLLAPPLLMVLALTVVSLLANRSRLGLDLAGGRLRALPELGPLWSAYLAEWHPVAGGTAAPASTALAVVGVVGGVLWPVAGSSGPAVAVSLLLLGALPLAGLSAYVATRPIRVGRVLRALGAAVYALLGITGAAVAQGRLDGVVVVVLLPLVLAGVVAVLRGSRTIATGDGARGRRTSWWSAAAGTSLLLAVVSAFAPLVHLMVLVVVVIGFVVVPAPPGTARRRTVALAAVVVLPVLLLLPWPSTLLRAPQVLLHGTGSPVGERFAGTLDVLSLDPGGAGSLPVVGLIVLVVAVGGALLAPRRSMVPGLGVMLLGIVAAGIVGTVSLAPLSGGEPRPGWTGPALAFAACGALWSLLALVAEARAVPLGTLVTGRSGPRHRPAPRQLGDPSIDLGPDGVLTRVGGGARSAASRVGTSIGSRLRTRSTAASSGRARGAAVPVAAAAGVALAVCTVLVGSAGALAARPAATLDPEFAGRLTASGATVVDVGLAPRPGGPGFSLDTDATRRSGADLPRYGDDDLVPVGAAPARLTRDVTALLSGDPATVQAGAAELAASGTAAVVLPDRGVAERAIGAGSPLLSAAAPTFDGRVVLGIGLPAAGAVILEPPVSDDATDAKAAPRRPSGISPLPGTPPSVGVLISPGADRRLVVLAAERESGWNATVGGAPAEIVPAWGHLVGVPVPSGGGPVVIDRDTTLRSLLLLLQLALVLFTVLSALPSRTRLD